MTCYRIATRPVMFANTTEIAVALHLSGDQLARELSGDQVQAVAAAAATRVGIDQIRRYAGDVHAVNLQRMAGQITARADRAWRKEFWSSLREEDLCIDLAWRVPLDAGIGPVRS
ncbi:MAG TPA: hypothetical protein VEO01_03700 [Pseudonocardiaceae bacterium]|nr:hypothetical protein [Pseudonocardiaceae bacterium]